MANPAPRTAASIPRPGAPRGAIGLGVGADSEPAVFSWADPYQKYSYLALLGFVALLVYSFWNTLESTSKFWSRDQYSHAYILPVVALYLMWAFRPNTAAQEPDTGQAEETLLGLIPATTLRNGSLSVAGVLIGVGYAMGSDLLQGVGFALGCLGLAAYVLLGQPFQQVSDAERWGGLAIVVAAYAARVTVGAPYEMEPIQQASFLAALFGVAMMIGGLGLLKWAGPGLAFLVFMFPLPTLIERPLLSTLQKLAAVASEAVLTILNLPVFREGSRLSFADMPDPKYALEVAEACSGLRMLTIFGALAVATALLIERPWWDRFIVLLSALPIALFVNVVRIVVTALGLRYLHFAAPSQEELFKNSIHDHAGLLVMMPLALALMYLELRVLAALSVPEDELGAQQPGLGAFASR